MRPALPTVVFDASPLVAPHPTGVSRYASELLRALLAAPRQVSFITASHRRLAFPQTHPGDLLPSLPTARTNRWLWMQAILPHVLARETPALCHFTNGFAPLRCPVPYVVTIHDTSLVTHAHTQPRRSLVLIRPLLRAIAQRARLVLVPSRQVATEVSGVFDVPPARVVVTPEGVAPHFGPVSDDASLRRIRQRYGLRRPYVLAVGTLEPRKNLERLVRAFMGAEGASETHDLLLAGHDGWRNDALLSLLADPTVARVVRRLGFVPDEDLPALYSDAVCCAFPSLYEGFGLPVLEAMACGTPVLASSTSGMHEVAGEAALLVEPTDVHALTDALARLITAGRLRDDLRERGLARAARFTWSATADRTCAAYEVAMSLA